MNVSLYALPALYSRRKPKLTTEDLPEILEIVCAHTEISVKKVRSKTILRDIVRVRFIYYYIARKNIKTRLVDIGAVVGRRQQGSVLNGLSQLEEFMSFEPDLKRLVNKIDASVKLLTTTCLEELTK